MSYEDKYLWLEKIDDPKVSRWIKEEDERLKSFLAGLAGRLKRRIARYYKVPYVLQVALSEAGLFILSREEGSYKVKIIRRNGEVVELVDSKSLGRDVVLKWLYVNKEGDRLSYTFSYAGEDLGVTRVMDVGSGEVIDEIRGFIRDITWINRETYYYVRFYRSEKTPDGIKPPTDRVFMRENGRDTMVFGAGVPTGHFISLKSSGDSSKALLTVSYGWTWSDVYAGDLRDPSSWRRIYGDSRFISVPVDWSNGFYYILSHEDKKGLGRIVRLDNRTGRRKVLIRPRKYPIQAAVMSGEIMVVHYLENASSTLRIYNKHGSLLRRIRMRPPGTVSSLSSADGEVTFKYESFHIPYIIYRVYSDGRVEEVAAHKPLGNYVVEEGWATSTDGTRIHMFKVRRGGSKGRVAIAYGYGGFGIALTPTYIPHILPFLRDGGVFVVANLRGGSEFGEEWHRAGMRENKQRVFEDFMSVIEKLKGEGYTVVAMGSSNGGLLVGAVVTQRPNLLDGAVIGYPVLDMLRFHKLYIGAAWIAEYGNPEDPDDRRFLLEYSPYHNVRRKRYPPILVYTGLHDDRVHPGHALKFVAKLREVNAPVLLRVERRSGHAGATPEVKVREYADIMAFIYRITGLHAQT